MQATIRTIGPGKRLHAMTAPNPKYLAVSCGVCGASKWSRCRGREGQSLAGIHKERREKWQREQS